MDDPRGMSDRPCAPIEVLERWEAFGGLWRSRGSSSADDAVVELCSCHGEPIDELRSSDPALARYLARRPTSED
jgi:hypothetical protein